MKNILIILILLISIGLSSQQIIYLCDKSVNEQYSVLPYPNIIWEINPEVTMDINNNIVNIYFENVGSYTLSATYFNGYCESSDKLQILVEGCVETVLWVPNSFTPNGDINNEYFKAYGENIKSFKMEIYNRWGEILFSSNDINKGWSGFYMNTLCQEDVYACKIIYQDYKGRFYEKITKITLIH